MGKEIFQDYVRYSCTIGRVNDPADFIAYLKQTRYVHGELDGLPHQAIILHDSRVEEFLGRLGIATEHYRPFPTGVTDPNLLYVVTPPDRAAFILNRGMPGGGGVGTQAAELVAMGVTSLVHVGTCGLVGDSVPSGAVVVSTAAYSDGTAALLARSEAEARGRLTRPDGALTRQITMCLTARNTAFYEAASYTIPTFYFQPPELIKDLITGAIFPDGPPVGYFEMEEAGFFATCALMQTAGASLVVGSDRYRLHDGQLTHIFEDNVDLDATELQIVEAILDAFNTPAPTTNTEQRPRADQSARPYMREFGTR